MARYFFHLRDGAILQRDDEEGEELRDLEAVRHYAIESAREILSEAALSGTAGRSQNRSDGRNRSDHSHHPGWSRHRYRHPNLNPSRLATHVTRVTAERFASVQSDRKLAPRQ